MKNTELYRFGKQDWLWAAALATLAILLNLNTLPGQFFMDDLIIVRDNPLVQHIDLGAIFTSDYWQSMPLNTGLYRPLTILSFGLNQWVSGAHPLGFHLVNLWLYGLVVGLAFLALRRLRQGYGISVFAVLLFAAHPLHAEVINQLVGRSELLAAVFLLLAIILAQGRGWGSYVLVAACFLAALFSKEHSIVLPGLLALTDLFFFPDLRERWRQRRGLYLLLALTAAGWLLLRSFGVDRSGLPAVIVSPVYQPQAFVPAWQRILSALLDQGRYLAKQLVPIGLQGIYSGPRGFVAVMSLLSTAGVGILLGLGLCGSAVWVAWRKKSILGLAALFYIISFLPTSNLFFVSAIFSERLTFFPSLWFCWGLAAVILGVHRSSFPAVALVGLSMTFMVLTPLRNQIYRDPIALWQHDLQLDSENPLARYFLATALDRAGRTADALHQFRRVTTDYPDFLDPLHDFALFLLNYKRPEEALRVAEDALRKTPGGYIPTALVLASAYQQTGQAQMALSGLANLAPAAQQSGLYWDIKARALEDLGNIGGAIENYARVHDLPRESDSFARFGKLLFKAQRFAEAEAIFRADADTRDLAESWNSLGVTLALEGKLPEAVKAFSRAVEKQPANQHFQGNLKRAQTNAVGRSSY